MSFAFGAGLLATVNPCGFVMLPSFLSMQLGMAEGTQDRRWLARCGQGLAIGLALSGAFSGVLVFAGLVLAAGLRSLVGAVPWMAVAVGAALTIAGGAMLAGHRISLDGARRVRLGAAGGSGYGRVAAFGVGYAIASLSCTLAVVLAVASQATATADPIQALGVLGAFAAGATSALLALTLSVALAKGFIAGAMRRLAPIMETIAGVMLLASGAYLISYWLPALLEDNGRPGGPIGETGERISSTVTRFLTSHSATFAIGLAIAAALAAGLAVSLRSQKR
jgi:cytochrome c-type biogenesis protein